MTENQSRKKYLSIITIVSILIPIVVAFLMFLPKNQQNTLDVSLLPHLHAILNSATAICLVLGFYFIKQRKSSIHKGFMLSAFIFSSIFLVSYVTYHYFGDHTIFGDLNNDKLLSEDEKEQVVGIRFIYYFVLLSHILLAAIVVPLVLLALYYAFSQQWAKHKKVTKWTFPVWLYVAITGVVVYFMIQPYY